MAAPATMSGRMEPGLIGVESSYSYFIDAWTRARSEVFASAEDSSPDEDVNIYVAYLLSGLAEGQYISDLRRCTSPYAHEVVAELVRCDDDLARYNVCKANADFLLLALGIFRGATRTLPLLPENPTASEQSLVRRARAFYFHAAALAGTLFGKNSAQARVLLKLATHFQRYLAVMRRVRDDALYIIPGLSHGEMYHLGRTVETVGEDMRRMRKWDEFLDALRLWELRPTDSNWTAVVSTGRELEKEDSNFSLERFEHSRC